MRPGAFFIARERTPGEAFQFVRLVGVFEYPEWVYDLARATPMTYARACQWAEAVKENAKDERPRVVAHPLDAASPPAPDTRRDGFRAEHMGTFAPYPPSDD